MAGLVISSEQPAAIDTPPSETSNVGAGGLDGNPAGVLAAPCGDEEVIGVLEVARVEGSGPFTVDDIEETTLLARIAGRGARRAGQCPAPRCPLPLNWPAILNDSRQPSRSDTWRSPASSQPLIGHDR